MANKAYVYRILPTKEQEILLKKTFGCGRFVYNKMLTVQQERYSRGEKHLSKMSANEYCNHVLKEEFPFLREVDKFALTNAIYHLEDGYNRFFQKQGGFPKFKSKHKSKNSYTTNYTNGNIIVGDDYIKLPKLGKVKAIIHCQPNDNWKLKSATVSQKYDGIYQVSVLFEYIEDIKPIVITEDATLGLDYASDGLYVDSEGNNCQMPHYYRKAQKKLAKLQRTLSRRQGSRKGETKSKNYLKQLLKVNKVHTHIANQRKDYLHKKSTEIANQYSCACVENLNMRAMSNKGFGNGKATLDNGYGMFLNMLDYKLHDRGGILIKVDKWFPSSQLCHVCGTKHSELKDLSIREWICPDCGTHHNRDHNAAINIKNQGLIMLGIA